MNKYQKKVHKLTLRVLDLATIARIPRDYKLARQVVREHMTEVFNGRSK